jgi:hypothetical protein
MKLSKDTVNLLKNFSTINNHLLLKQGNKLATISNQKNVFASATVAETFDTEFGIYDLGEFLSAMSLFEDPELTFNDKYVTLKEGKNSIRYYAADPSNLTLPPAKSVALPSEDVKFTLTTANFSMIHRTASVLRAGDVAIIGDGTTLKAVVADKKNATSNAFEVDLGTTTSTFKANLKVENLKMVPGDYEVSISSKRISQFKGSTSDLVYFVAVEADSTF